LVLTSAERRGALVLILLLLIGAGHDLWCCFGARPAAGPVSFPPPASSAGPETLPADTVPAAAPAGPSPGAGRSAPRAGKARAPVDLNRAGVPELESLPGIGPTLAGRIAEQRRRYGPFRELEDLLAVRGVGPRLLERLRPWARVTARQAGDSLAAVPALR
jgi:competence ComEA-like helix-hairpin-helix protein